MKRRVSSRNAAKRRARLRRLLPLMLSVIVVGSASACGGDGGAPPQGSGAPTETPRSFTEADLPSLVLQEDEAPEDSGYSRGPIALADVAPTPTLLDAFRSGGFVGAYRSGFGAPQGGPNAVSIVILFESEEGASEAVTLIRDDFRSVFENGGPVDELSPGELGDEAVGLQQLETFNGPVFGYFWRVGNAMMMFSSGAIDLDQFDTLARAMGPDD